MTSKPFNALALALLLPLAACGQASHDTAQSGAAGHAAQDTAAAPSSSMISSKVQAAIQQAKQELASENIDVNNIHIGSSHGYKNSRPKAEITPQGQLLIGGKEVAATPAQQRLLLDYRRQIIGIAEAGMDIGKQGADLGIQAGKAALWGALSSGKSDKDIEAAIKPQTDKIQAAALQLCQRLPDLRSSQQALAAQMPAFRPYATMEQKDVEDCGKDMRDKNGKHGFAVFSD